MELSPSPAGPSPPSRFAALHDRLATLTEVVTVALLGSVFVQGLFVLSGLSPMTSARLLAVFMWLEASFTLLLITLLLRARRRNWRDLGWTAQGWKREAGLGILVVPVLFVFTLLIGVLFQKFLPQYVSEKNPLLEMIKTQGDLALFLASSVFVGGLKEEVQRAFILRHFERNLGGIWTGLFVWSIVFALLHQVQGVDKAAGAGVLGLLFGLLYISRKKLTSPVVAHALYDISTLVMFWSIMRSGA